MDNGQNNKRIAKNTAHLYLRSLVTLLISLYTSRVVLATLGIEDYGIYNVVGSFVAMFSIVSGSLTAATGRFLSYELGRGDKEALENTFASALSIHIAIGCAIVILGELIGIWFLNNKLNIPSERMLAANWALQFSIFSFVVSIINVPYSASIISHERMAVYAYLGLFEAFAKLAIVYALCVTEYDRLIVYGFLLVAVSVTVQLLYFLYCRRAFSECRFRWGVDNKLLRSLVSFVGWAFLGNGAVVIKNQGVTILLNMFCGPIVNAAQGVANQIESVSTRFIYSYMTASNPQIIKLYSSNEKSSMHRLIMRSSRFSLYLMLLISLPIILNVDTILNWWLVSVPAHTSSFTILIIAYTGLECLAGPLVTGVLSTGRIKKYEIMITVTYLLMVVAVYFSLNMGFAPEIAFILSIVFKLVIICILLQQSRANYQLRLFDYFLWVIKPSMAVVSIAAGAYLLMSFVDMPNLGAQISLTLLAELFLVSAMWSVGIDTSERQFVLKTVRSRMGINKKE